MSSIERIKALCEKATGGPWVVGIGGGRYGVMTDEKEADLICDYPRWMDADFIAHARQLIPLMLRVIESHDHFLASGWEVGLDDVNEAWRKLESYCEQHLGES